MNLNVARRGSIVPWESPAAVLMGYVISISFTYDQFVRFAFPVVVGECKMSKMNENPRVSSENPTVVRTLDVCRVDRTAETGESKIVIHVRVSIINTVICFFLHAKKIFMNETH